MVWLDKLKETEDGNCVVEIENGSPTPLVELEREKRENLIQEGNKSLNSLLKVPKNSTFRDPFYKSKKGPSN